MSRPLFAVAALSALVLTAGCRSRNPDVGRACDSEMTCPTGMHCLPDAEGDTVCMEACASDDMTTCLDGSLCLDTTLGARVCWIGGPASIGDVCTSHTECENGGLCVRIDGMPDATCFRACNVGSTNDCFEDQSCVATSDGSHGFCVP